MTYIQILPLVELSAAILAQVEIPDQPQNLVTLQWVIIVALGLALTKLYRDREQDRQEMIERTYVIAENATDAMNTMASALEDINDGLDLTGQIRDIQEELRGLKEDG